MVKTQAILQGEHTPASGRLCVALELGSEQWKLSSGDGHHNPSRYVITAGDTNALMSAVQQAKKRLRGGAGNLNTAMSGTAAL